MTYGGHEKTWKKTLCILLNEHTSEKGTYYIIPTIKHSENGKTMETVRRLVFAKG